MSADEDSSSDGDLPPVALGLIEWSQMALQPKTSSPSALINDVDFESDHVELSGTEPGSLVVGGH